MTEAIINLLYLSDPFQCCLLASMLWSALTGCACKLAQKRCRERQKEKKIAIVRQIEDLSVTADRLVVDIARLKRRNAALESKLRV